MPDEAIAKFLEGGCALIVATVSPDGEPYATRAWGLDIVPGDPLRARVLLAADDHRTIAHLGGSGRIAVTGGDVRTLRSIQLKGRAVGIEPVRDKDRARAGRYLDEFFTAVVETDGTPRHTLERIIPLDYVVCTITVEEIYDQTPGPCAGASVAEDRA